MPTRASFKGFLRHQHAGYHRKYKNLEQVATDKLINTSLKKTGLPIMNKNVFRMKKKQIKYEIKF